MIIGNDIEFSYDENKDFIKNLNINIEKGKITTILGPNGSGKSTLLSLLCGINKVKNGEILIDNLSIKKMKYKDIAKKVATVHQQNSVPNDITVENLISYGRLPHKKFFEKENKNDNDIVKWAINCTGLEKYRNKPVMSLSGGERQRVFISMALAQKPEVLFLDEPTTYLDIYHQIEILELVKSINKDHGITVVMVLHDINQAIKYSHNIVVMRNGCLIKSGNAKNIMDINLLKEVYKVDGIMNNLENEQYFIPTKVCNL
ncbi:MULTISPECIES: ABC transporter ATP-binding protein [unclassified Romboutsia]|uniref:ABC transporter ATP-binding protein n=1 Tax=unclassified Romboutsia TaxID=2626894 RepID=UPI000820EE81|nr:MULTISPECIES: ABC transporter ATP-binding protein [unclassified Romboutsia]SCH40302.1 Probable siderophore transport system ATP-binding protein YusV [uncultured Clostridium sp.]